MAIQLEIPQPVTDPTFLTAKIHALRAKILDGAQLAKLAFLDSPGALYQRFLGTRVAMTPSEAQRAVIARHVAHILHILRFINGRQREMFKWLVRRYQVENLKVVLRGWARKMTREQIDKDLIPMPGEHSLPVEEMLACREVGALVSLVPEPHFIEGMLRAIPNYERYRQAFFLEAALERSYYSEALARAGRLFSSDRKACLPLIQRETLCYNIILTLRCMQTYRLATEEFSDLMVPYAPFDRPARAIAFLSNPVDSLLDTIPSLEPMNPQGRPVRSISDLEEICTRYLYRAARKQFVASVFDFGAVVAYYYLKRFELQDILRLGEAIRLGQSAEEAREQLITAGEVYA